MILLFIGFGFDGGLFYGCALLFGGSGRGLLLRLGLFGGCLFLLLFERGFFGGYLFGLFLGLGLQYDHRDEQCDDGDV